MQHVGLTLEQQRDVMLDAKQQAAVAALEGQYYIAAWPYYSKFKLFAVRTNAPPGPYVYNLAQGVEVRAFSYAVRQNREAAGYTLEDGLATFADTNIVLANQTTAAQEFFITGMALQIVPSFWHIPIGGTPPARQRPTDMRFLESLYNACAVSLSLNGDDQQYRLGNFGMLPGAGGLSGAGFDSSGQVALAGEGRLLESPVNGLPTRSNFKPFPEGILWRRQGNRDSMLNLIIDVTRPVQIFSGGSPENNINGVDTAANNAVGVVATGTEGYIYPQEIGVEIMVILIGKITSPRSQVT